MALAPVAYCLWQEFLRFDPLDPAWPNRDRFVLSAGHASMLLYSLLHLTEVRAVSKDYERLREVAVPLEALKAFRQLDSRCPGHPEYRWTSGVETTTGPLGQGVATSVGMAMARQWLAARYNKPGFELFDFNVSALCGDGCMMEGISSEAASLAGHLQLSNLCWIYDNNHITIEGNTALAFSEDVATRFLAYGWNVTRVGDANDLDMLARAFRTFQNTHDRPTLIIVDSHIGYGAPPEAVRPGEDSRGPGNGEVESDPLDDRPVEQARIVADGHATHDAEEGVAQMAHHLVSGHPTPPANALRAYRLEAPEDLRLVARPGQGLHAARRPGPFAWFVTGRGGARRPLRGTRPAPAGGPPPPGPGARGSGGPSAAHRTTGCAPGSG